MNLPFFQKLRPATQMSFVLTLGTYLLTRQQEAKEEVHLYHLDGEGKGFFVEVMYEPRLDRLVVVRSFAQLAYLTDYMAAVQLPASSYLD